jgi:hypothetical protein
MHHACHTLPYVKRREAPAIMMWCHPYNSFRRPLTTTYHIIKRTRVLSSALEGNSRSTLERRIRCTRPNHQPIQQSHHLDRTTVLTSHIMSRRHNMRPATIEITLCPTLDPRRFTRLIQSELSYRLATITSCHGNTRCAWPRQIEITLCHIQEPIRIVHTSICSRNRWPPTQFLRV